MGLVLAPLLFQGSDEEETSKLQRVKWPALAGLIVYLVVFGIALFARPLPECANYECADICS